MAFEGVFYLDAWVSDLTRSKQFYGETLGWTLETDIPDVLAGYRFGPGYLVIKQDQREADARPYPGGMHVAVRVDGLDEQHARLAARGVQVSVITLRPYGGVRDFTFADPDGYLWLYGQAAGESGADA